MATPMHPWKYSQVMNFTFTKTFEATKCILMQIFDAEWFKCNSSRCKWLISSHDKSFWKVLSVTELLKHTSNTRQSSVQIVNDWSHEWVPEICFKRLTTSACQSLITWVSSWNTPQVLDHLCSLLTGLDSLLRLLSSQVLHNIQESFTEAHLLLYIWII